MIGCSEVVMASESTSLHHFILGWASAVELIEQSWLNMHCAPNRPHFEPLAIFNLRWRLEIGLTIIDEILFLMYRVSSIEFRILYPLFG